MTARLVPFTADGLIWAASMAVLDASRRNQPVPRLAALSLGAEILAHGVGQARSVRWSARGLHCRWLARLSC